VRAWGTYVAVQVALLVQEWKELSAKGWSSDEERRQIKRRKREVVFSLVANVTRLPVILHWSLVGGFYKNDIWTDIFSLVSGVVAFRGGWEGHVLPPPKR